MPHVDISMFPGRDRETKTELALKIRDLIVEELKVNVNVVTVSIEDIPREQWSEHMKKFREEDLFVKPGY